MLLPLVALCAVALACTPPAKEIQKTPYKTLGTDSSRNTQKAAECNARAVELLKDNQVDAAEKELTEALTADVFFGPAHNNLGTVYYRQKKYYLCAWEFQYAAKLMPNKAEPKGNLGMVFEAVGKTAEATKYYEEALTIEPDDIETAANLARVLIAANRKDDRTRKLLDEIVMKDTRPQWVSWAKERLAIMGKPAATSQPVPEE